MNEKTVNKWRKNLLGPAIIATLIVVMVATLVTVLHFCRIDSKTPYQRVVEYLETIYYSDEEEHAAARRLGREAVPVLAQVLRLGEPSSKLGEDRLRSVVALGEIGDESSVESLIYFLENTGGEVVEVNQDARNALFAVPLALGKIAARSSEKAVENLIIYANPETWKERELPWARVKYPSFKDLLRNSLYGLGLSGQRRAREALEQIRAHATNPQHVRWTTQAIEISKRFPLQQRLKYMQRIGLDAPDPIPTWYWDIIDKVRYGPSWFRLMLGSLVVILGVCVWLTVKKLRQRHRPPDGEFKTA
jgi:hypothetical protein